MKTHSRALFVLLNCILASAACAESGFEREFQQLLEQRDKALAAAAAPINARFKAAAEQLLKRATQNGDLAAANKIHAALGTEESTSSPEAVKDLRKQLAGTTWKAATAPLRGGLAATLTFTEKSVEPGGYRYDVDSSRTVTIVFTGGDKQLMTLTKGGKRLEFTHGRTEHAYDIAPK